MNGWGFCNIKCTKGTPSGIVEYLTDTISTAAGWCLLVEAVCCTSCIHFAANYQASTTTDHVTWCIEGLTATYSQPVFISCWNQLSKIIWCTAQVKPTGGRIWDFFLRAGQWSHPFKGVQTVVFFNKPQLRCDIGWKIFNITGTEKIDYGRTSKICVTAISVWIC